MGWKCDFSASYILDWHCVDSAMCIHESLVLYHNSPAHIYNDDCINDTKNNSKRVYRHRIDYFSCASINTPTMDYHNSDTDIYNDYIGLHVHAANKKRKLNNDEASSFCTTIQKSNTYPIPDIVIKQLHLEKCKLSSILEILEGLKYIKPSSSNELDIDKDMIGYINNRLTTIFVLFDCSTVKFVKYFKLFQRMNLNIVGITPEYKYFNDCPFPILLDRHGNISKQLGLRNPIGGGIYPIPSIVIFDKSQNEVVRIKLGYDHNIYYDCSSANNLHSLLDNIINYTTSV